MEDEYNTGYNNELINNRRSRMKWQTKMIIILSILLILLSSYVGYVFFIDYRDNVYNAGRQQGALEEIVSLNKNAVFPLIDDSSGNATINNIAINDLCVRILQNQT